eukprot:486474-Pelagomonas_calceolata.AAC.1
MENRGRGPLEGLLTGGRDRSPIRLLPIRLLRSPIRLLLTGGRETGVPLDSYKAGAPTYSVILVPA